MMKIMSPSQKIDAQDTNLPNAKILIIEFGCDPESAYKIRNNRQVSNWIDIKNLIIYPFEKEIAGVLQLEYNIRISDKQILFY